MAGHTSSDRRGVPGATIGDRPEIPITVRGDIDDRATEQLKRCAEAGGAVAGVLCADGHVGYSQPIGGAVAYPDHISPSGVGTTSPAATRRPAPPCASRVCARTSRG